MNTRQIVIIACVILMLPMKMAAQDKANMFNPINTSVTSQTIAPDARAAGMGDVGAATDPDVVSQYWNPAKYPFTISRAGVSLNYTPWLRQLVSDIDLAYLVGYYRIGDYSAVSGSLRYFSLGEVYTNSSMTGEDDMTINPYEMSLDVAYSLMLSEHFSISAGGGYTPTLRMTIPRIRLPVRLSLLTSPCITRTTLTLDQGNVSWDWVSTSRISVARLPSAAMTTASSFLQTSGSVRRS